MASCRKYEGTGAGQERASTYAAPLYRMLTLRSMELPTAEPAPLTALAAGAVSRKIGQKRSVSSAAAEHTVVPSGDWARCSTLQLCRKAP